MADAGLPEHRQTDFMLYATLKNKHRGKGDASWAAKEQDREQVGDHDTAHDGAHDKLQSILDFCTTPK